MIPWDKVAGKTWLASGRLSAKQWDAALLEHQRSGGRLEDVLLKTGLLAAEELGQGLSAYFGLPFFDLSKFEPKPEVKRLLPETALRRYKMFPLGLKEGRLQVATPEPKDLDALDYLRLSTGKDIELHVTTESGFRMALSKHFGFQDSIALRTDLGLRQALSPGDAAQRLLELAVTHGASDIHFESQENGLFALFRIDGTLQAVFQFPKNQQNAALSKLKIMASIDIAETRLPQDGQILLPVKDRAIDLRVSTLGSKWGESMVIRVLDKGGLALSLDRLGMGPEMKSVFEGIVERPHGLVLVTGPTGSGKTSSLYATVQHLRAPSKKFITIEDPIEYDLADGKRNETGITQVQVNAKAGLTFAGALRAALRQDPDVIMVGEIRDRETADIAMRAAMTGHMVLSTLHTNGSVESAARLLEMGVEPFVVAAALKAVLAQRLVRVLCTDCRTPFTPPADRLAEWGDLGTALPAFHLAVGCDRCRGTGYRGRTGIFELLLVDPSVQEIILQGGSLSGLKAQADKQAMTTLRRNGLALAARGITSIEEVYRVTSAA